MHIVILLQPSNFYHNNVYYIPETVLKKFFKASLCAGGVSVTDMQKGEGNNKPCKNAVPRYLFIVFKLQFKFTTASLKFGY